MTLVAASRGAARAPSASDVVSDARAATDRARADVRGDRPRVTRRRFSRAHYERRARENRLRRYHASGRTPIGNHTAVARAQYDAIARESDRRARGDGARFRARARTSRARPPCGSRSDARDDPDGALKGETRAVCVSSVRENVCARAPRRASDARVPSSGRVGAARAIATRARALDARRDGGARDVVARVVVSVASARARPRRGDDGGTRGVGFVRARAGGGRGARARGRCSWASLGGRSEDRSR